MSTSADVSVADLAAAVASVDPSPGASCSAAASAALAAALVAMSARQTEASDPFSAAAHDMEAVALAADELRGQLLAAAEDDGKAFERVMSARREAAHGEIQTAYRAALEPPLDVCRLSLRVLALAREVAARGHPFTIPAAATAELLASAALEAVALNVEFELRAIDDEEFVQDTLAEVAHVRDEACALRVAATTHG